MPAKLNWLVSTFDKSNPSGAFFDWIQNNQDGFFINTFQRTNPRYIRLHSAKCKIATSTKRYGSDGATQNQYKKVCSKSPEALVNHLVIQEGVLRESISPCQKCDARELKRLFRDAPDEVLSTTDEALDEEGFRKLVTHFDIERSSRNRRLVLRDRPKPYACDACEISLDIYGPEYETLIHVHHSRPIGHGVQAPKKADFLLLCPNCHAVAHWRRATDPLNLTELKKRAATVRSKLANER